MSKDKINEIVKELISNPEFEEGIVVKDYSAPKQAELCDFPSELALQTIEVFKDNSISHLYRHQYSALVHVLNGENLAISTGTASGKSLSYMIPIIDSLIKTKNSCSLLLFPTKALCHDQKIQISQYLNSAQSISGLSIDCGVYDGDTVRDERKRIRDKAQIVLSNPDMFNIGILPNHTEWARFFVNLKYIIIDEVHVYRGIFGSHFTNLIRRFKRICSFYGSFPKFIICSATLSNIHEFAEKLIEEKTAIVDLDFSQKGSKHFLIYNPPFVNKELGIRRSYIQETIRILKYLQNSGLQILLFARSRRNVEMIYKALGKDEETINNVKTYRSGYLASTRRNTEIEMKSSKLKTIIATNALELGIDIGGIDIVLLCGYPGSIAATRQQSGRAGRRNQAALSILITNSDPLEQYLASNPDFILKKAPEQALIEPDNPYLILSHLSSAVFELPFKTHENYGSLNKIQLDYYLNLLQRMQKTKLSNDSYYWISEKYPAEDISLRIADSTQFTLICNNQIISKLDKQSALWMTHPGAVYLQAGVVYLVDKLDLEKAQVFLLETDPGYYTEHLSKTEIEMIEIEKQENIGKYQKYFGKLKVTNFITAFKKIHWSTHEILDYVNLELPPSVLLTKGYWFSLNPDLIDSLKDNQHWYEEVNNYGYDWDKIRDKILIRDQYQCQACGKSCNIRLEIHHIIPFKMFKNKAQANDLNNLVTLCPSCHKEAENMVKIQSALSGLTYLLHNLAPLFLMCEKHDLGIHKEAIAIYADQKPCILFYDSVPGGIGMSEKLFTVHESLLKEAENNLLQCECLDGCPSCTGAVSENGWGAKHLADIILKGLNNDR